MDDISTLLTRAAATPTVGPDIDDALRTTRRRRLAVVTTIVVLAAVIAIAVSSTLPKNRSTNPRVVADPSTLPTTPTTTPAVAYRDQAHLFSIGIPVGWFRSAQPLEPWLHSPHEVLSIATALISPSPLPGNQAACPSEIPKVAVDAIGRDGAYLGIYEWIRGEGTYDPEPWPQDASRLDWLRECPLPNGIVALGATFTDGNRDFTVHMVLGADATARRSEIYAALDSFHPDPAPSTTTTTVAGLHP